MNKRITLGILLFVLVLAADQLTKLWILYGIDLPNLGRIELLPILELTYVRNRGITFGLLNGGIIGPLVLGAFALIIVAGLFWWLRKAESNLVAAALGAIAGGAVGNVIDRVRYGAVIDFLHLHAWNWDPFRYVFNVGDSAIVCGVTALLIDGLIEGMHPSHKGQTSGREAP